MECLERIKTFRYEMEEELTEEEIKNKKIWFNYDEPQNYLIKNLNKVSISALGGILKFMHIKYLPTLVNELKQEGVIS